MRTHTHTHTHIYIVGQCVMTVQWNYTLPFNTAIYWAYETNHSQQWRLNLWLLFL